METPKEHFIIHKCMHTKAPIYIYTKYYKKTSLNSQYSMYVYSATAKSFFTF